MDGPTQELAANLPTAFDNPTDLAIRCLLANGPLPTAEIARQLATSERTIRYRLGRLRDAGAVTWDEAGRYRLAGRGLPAASDLAGRGLPAASDLAGRGLPPGGGLAGPAQDESTPANASQPSHTWNGETVLAVVAVGVAAVIGVGWYWMRVASAPAPQPVEPPAPWPGTGLYPGWRGW